MRGDLLDQVMSETGTTQSRLSRLSGVHQPSISQFVSGRTELSDDMLGRLLECTGYQLEVTRRSLQPDLTRSERRSWQLHQQLSLELSPQTLEDWIPHIESRLEHLRTRITGQPHTRNLERWIRLVHDRDVPGIRRILNGLDRGSIEMREVSPLGGLLSDEERLQTSRSSR
ncbi:DNA-binding protein [Knoellia sinensis KCTC 19936]|uniref:DNA-binding protein n=1 Tax=Knoellia sinensis KCTC 19936 TaxID=1385520 RepID=A0A0A0IY26_9MICO|nr:helix-turn-helix transcriptional regulator [Knoellia sinensis]KGN29688.1 DNA-binding protein [Knoellia sinensis KCTC 19936]